MKKLSELFDIKNDSIINSIEDDSRVKGSNILFCAVKGINVDGHDFVDKAINNGAVAIISEKELDVNVPVIKVQNSSLEMNRVLNDFYDKPLNSLKLIGVTGTDGKTTTTNIIYQLLSNLVPCGIIGTKLVECPNYHEEQAFTTPLPRDLFKFFDVFIKNDCRYSVMEVSSERLGTNRLDGINFDISIFTNISPDHLDTHKTMENYVSSKTKLFQNTKKDGYCIINVDDEYSKEFIENSNGKVITYGINNEADYKATNIIIGENNLIFTLNSPQGEHMVLSPLSGKYNVYNIMASIITLVTQNYDINSIIESIKYLRPIAGRHEEVKLGQRFKVIVDFAHTANAVKNLIEFERSVTKGRIIMVLGTGGDRYMGRKIELGKTVTDFSDHVFLTTYNPRSEEPIDLINDMLREVDKSKKNYTIVIDREEAIRKAINMASVNDTILITGKAREHYQVYKGQYIPYKGDYEIATECIKELLIKQQ